MLTFVHLSTLKETEEYCRSHLNIKDIVRYPEHFAALDNRLTVSNGDKSMQMRPTVGLIGTFSAEDKKLFLALKKRFSVSRKKVDSEFLQLEED